MVHRTHTANKNSCNPTNRPPYPSAAVLQGWAESLRAELDTAVASSPSPQTTSSPASTTTTIRTTAASSNE